MQWQYDPHIVVVGIYSREARCYVNTETCRQMFIVALFVTVQNWKIFKDVFSTGEWLKKIVVLPYHGILLRNEKQWTINTCNSLDENPENYMSETKPNPKVIYCWILFIWIFVITNYRNGEKISIYQWLRGIWECERNRCGCKRTAWGILEVKEIICISTESILWLYIVQYFCEMLPVGKPR